ncbi:MAG: energy transducer TonB [Spirochaetes bacterium]|nr:energy transducer TonB [Spirochaetota bacterium]
MIDKKKIIHLFNKHIKVIIILVTILFHVLLLFAITINPGQKQKRKDNRIFKMTDITEFIPPVDNKIEISRQEDIAEIIIETDKEIKELDIDYLPQHKISESPVFPVKQIKSRKLYPPLANKQGIEGTVYLELFIDQTGLIRKITILKDPGYGFAEAAMNAFKGIRCIPAKSNGIPVAVRFRRSVRFVLKK